MPTSAPHYRVIVCSAPVSSFTALPTMTTCPDCGRPVGPTPSSTTSPPATAWSGRAPWDGKAGLVIELDVLGHALYVPGALALGSEGGRGSRGGLVQLTEHEGSQLQQGGTDEEGPV